MPSFKLYPHDNHDNCNVAADECFEVWMQTKPTKKAANPAVCRFPVNLHTHLRLYMSHYS